MAVSSFGTSGCQLLLCTWRCENDGGVNARRFVIRTLAAADAANKAGRIDVRKGRIFVVHFESEGLAGIRRSGRIKIMLELYCVLLELVSKRIRFTSFSWNTLSFQGSHVINLENIARATCLVLSVRKWKAMSHRASSHIVECPTFVAVIELIRRRHQSRHPSALRRWHL